MVKPATADPHSNLVETNTLYMGKDILPPIIAKTIKINGWDFCPVDIMDEDGAVMIPVKAGSISRICRLAKICSIRLDAGADPFQRACHGRVRRLDEEYCHRLRGRVHRQEMVHAALDNEDYESWLKGEPFQENMVESAKATIDHFGKRIVYINVLRICPWTATALA